MRGVFSIYITCPDKVARQPTVTICRLINQTKKNIEILF